MAATTAAVFSNLGASCIRDVLKPLGAGWS